MAQELKTRVLLLSLGPNEGMISKEPFIGYDFFRFRKWVISSEHVPFQWVNPTNIALIDGFGVRGMVVRNDKNAHSFVNGTPLGVLLIELSGSPSCPKVMSRAEDKINFFRKLQMKRPQSLNSHARQHFKREGLI